jgi:hypothetical protein
MIVSCGDSFFYGSDLKDCGIWEHPSQSTWPALIAKSLNLSYVSSAKAGVGNLQILQQVISNLLQYKNSSFYFINWTWIDRFDYVNLTNKDWHTVRPSFDNPTVDQFYYKHLHSELSDKFNSLVYINQAISLLEKYQCKFVMTYMDKLVLDQQWHAPEYVKLLQQQVRKHLKDFDGHTFLEWSRLNHYPESTGWHPLEPAHRQASEYWLPIVKEMIK